MTCVGAMVVLTFGLSTAALAATPDAVYRLGSRPLGKPYATWLRIA